MMEKEHLASPSPVLDSMDIRKMFPGCKAGKTELTIGPDGYVYPCKYLRYDKFRAGNILENSLKEIWEEDPIVKLFGERSPDTIKNEKCQKCSWLNRCIAGCPALTWLLYKDFYTMDPRCPLAYPPWEIEKDKLV